MKELQELEELVSQATSEKVGQVEIVGVITYANADVSEIRLQDIKTKELLNITVPRHLINEIVKSFWADVVQVKGRKTAGGAVLLDEITKAA